MMIVFQSCIDTTVIVLCTTFSLMEKKKEREPQVEINNQLRDSLFCDEDYNSMFLFHDQNLSSDHEFIRQTNLFADFLDEIVAQLVKSNEKSIVEMCRRLGAKHASSARMHFEPDWWRLFLHGILCGIKSNLNDRYSKRTSLKNVVFNVILPIICPLYRANINRRMADIVQAWDTLLNHIIDLISSAFYETRLAQNSRMKIGTDRP